MIRTSSSPQKSPAANASRHRVSRGVSFLTGITTETLEAVRSSSRNLKLRSSQTRRGGGSTELLYHNYTYNVGIERMAGADTRSVVAGRRVSHHFELEACFAWCSSRGDR